MEIQKTRSLQLEILGLIIFTPLTIFFWGLSIKCVIAKCFPLCLCPIFLAVVGTFLIVAYICIIWREAKLRKRIKRGEVCIHSLGFINVIVPKQRQDDAKQAYEDFLARHSDELRDWNRKHLKDTARGQTT